MHIKYFFRSQTQHRGICLQVILLVIQPFYEKEILKLLDHGEGVGNAPCPENFPYFINFILYLTLIMNVVFLFVPYPSYSILCESSCLQLVHTALKIH